MATQTEIYPSLETIANLTRVFLNDWQKGATSTPGEGQITTDDPVISPQTLPALNSSIREVYRELRNVGSPSFIRDNVQVAMPANAVTGPTIQTYLSFNGWFDGQTLQASPTLPADMLYPVELWEQQTTAINTLPFVRMSQPQFGLASRNQTFALGEWEWRGGAAVTAGTGGSDAIFFVGCLAATTIRIRYYAALTTFITPVAYATTFVPIEDCQEAVAYKTAYKIASALKGTNPATADLKANAAEAMRQLKLAYVRRAQSVEYHRRPYDSNSNVNFTSGNNII